MWACVIGSEKSFEVNEKSQMNNYVFIKKYNEGFTLSNGYTQIHCRFYKLSSITLPTPPQKHAISSYTDCAPRRAYPILEANSSIMQESHAASSRVKLAIAGDIAQPIRAATNLAGACGGVRVYLRGFPRTKLVQK